MSLRSGWFYGWTMLALAVCLDAPGQTSPAELFAQANVAYEAQDYPRAVQLYTQMLDTGLVNGYVEYNLGNAHFRSGDLGAAILHLQRARQLLPRFQDAALNLAEVESKRADIVEADAQRLPAGIRILLSVHRATNLNEATVLWMVLSWLLAGWLMLPLLVRGWPGPIMWTWTAITLGLLLLLQGWSVGAKFHARYQAGQAVIVADQTPVTTSPGGGSLRLTVNPGTYATLLSRRGEFAHIRLSQGVVGFVPGEAVAEIWPRSIQLAPSSSAQ